MKHFTIFLFICSVYVVSAYSSLFSQTTVNFFLEYGNIMSQKNAFDDMDKFFEVIDSTKIYFEKTYGDLPQEYKFFYYDLKYNSYDNKKFKKAIFHYLRSIYFYMLELHQKAFEDLKVARTIFKELNANLYVFDSYMMSAVVSLEVKDTVSFLKMANNAKQWLPKIKNDTARWDRTAVLNWNYGRYYLEFNDLEKAKFYLDSSRSLVSFLENLSCVYQVKWIYYIFYQALIQYFAKTNNLDSALKILEIRKTKFTNYFSDDYTHYFIDLLLVYKLQKDYQSIIKEIEKMFHRLSNNDFFKNNEKLTFLKIQYYDDLAEAYFNIGKKDTAYKILMELNQLNEATKINNKPLQAIQAKFDLESKLREEEYRYTINYIIFGSILLLILISVSIYYIRYRKIKKLNSKLDELNENKNRLFSIISHDLRGPILNNHQLLENIIHKYDKIDETSKRNMLENIRNGMQKVSDLLENLLNWSQFQITNSQISRSEFSIRTAIEDVIGQVEYISKTKNITINLECSSNDKIKFNLNEFQVLVRNLLTNALKFTNQNGNIDIKVKSQNGRVALEISDNGIGMTENYHQSIFKFEKLRKNGTNGKKGSGLGLIIVRDIVKRNNGNIEFEQNVPSGLKVQIDLVKQ